MINRFKQNGPYGERLELPLELATKLQKLNWFDFGTKPANMTKVVRLQGKMFGFRAEASLFMDGLGKGPVYVGSHVGMRMLEAATMFGVLSQADFDAVKAAVEAFNARDLAQTRIDEVTVACENAGIVLTAAQRKQLLAYGKTGLLPSAPKTTAKVN